MNPPPPPFPTEQRDAENIRLLSIFHYVAAGLGLVGLLFLIGHFFLMRTVLGVMKEVPASIEKVPEAVEKLPGDQLTPPDLNQSGEPDPTLEEMRQQVTPVEKEAREAAERGQKLLGQALDSFAIFYLIGGGFIVLKIILNLLSAGFLAARKNKIFSMVVAGLNCVSIPLGTILGVFTLIVLSRASVENLYRKAAESGAHS